MSGRTDAEYAAMTLPRVGTCVVTADEARMDLAYFDALLEYSSSLPTGTFIGKRWKRYEPKRSARGWDGLPTRWVLGEYIDIGDAHQVGIVWRRIVQVAPTADALGPTEPEPALIRWRAEGPG